MASSTLSTALSETQLHWIDTLEKARDIYPLPPGLRKCTDVLARHVMALLFPHYAGYVPESSRNVREELEYVREALVDAMRPLIHDRSDAAANDVIAALPSIHQVLLEDAQFIYDGDAAARSTDEVILAYPGFLAVALYRVAHEIHRAEVPLLPRLLTEYAHRSTGIDIHPGAQIGRKFAIDHGTGVVIGETTIIGDRVRVFQGVTLGALSLATKQTGEQRHPTIEDDVILYANATILGGRTVIGARSVIGGNVWLTKSVPPDSVVTHRSDVRLRSEADSSIEYHI